MDCPESGYRMGPFDKECNQCAAPDKSANNDLTGTVNYNANTANSNRY